MNPASPAQPSAKDGVRDELPGIFEKAIMAVPGRTATGAATTGAGLVDGQFLALLDKHRRHVELSPGVGADVQTYALAVIDDIRIDGEAAIGREVGK